MILRLRCRAGVYLSAILLFVGMALTVTANEPITRSQAESMIDARLAAAGIIVFGAFWVLLLTISGRSERALTASIVRLEAAVTKFTSDLAVHDSSPYAHAPASEHNHAPLMAEIGKVKADIERVEKDAERIETGLEEFLRYCKTHQCAMGSRDPAESPRPKRKTDSGDDYTPLRGKP